MKKELKSKIIAAGIILAVIVIAYFIYISGPQVSAIGNSQIKAQPDLTSVYVNVESRNPNAQIAQDKVSEISTELLGKLKELGLDDKDIQLANYNVYPEYEWVNGKQNLKGYIATQQIVIELSEFDKISSVINAASDSGALISGINFELSQEKQNEYKAQALKSAGEDAEIKAISIASGFGKKLGRLVSVQSQEFNYYPYPLYARGDVAVGGNAEAQKAVIGISPSDIEVSASISAVYTMTRF